jgi:lysozyme
MFDQQLLVDHLIWAEAEKLDLYKDSVGILTIGVGHNIEEKGISRAVSRQILKEDITSVLSDCAMLTYWTALDPVRQLVIADMVFNLGLSRFLNFKNLNKALLIQDYNLAAAEMVDSRWYRQVGRRAVKLHEAMITGVWNG